MGNRNSSTPQYPPPWAHRAYSASPSPYLEPKRPIAPGAFAEPYLPHAQHRRSMLSLNGDSGFPTPSDSERLRMRGSRMSLNQIMLPPDPKTLKKLEKMEKKHQKLLKKLGARGLPLGPPMPPPPPLYSRAMSYDDINRIHEVDMRQRDWHMGSPTHHRGPPIRHGGPPPFQQHKPTFAVNEGGSAPRLRQHHGGSLASSSPVTSSEEGHSSADPWSFSSSKQHSQRESMSPLFSSTPQQMVQSPREKTIEVRVQRHEKVERSQTDSGRSSGTATYAEPMPRSQGYSSRSSSITTSQLRGDQSEIDFSWVSEEEDKLRRERRTSVPSMPECYFGMEPPTVSENKENSGNVHQKAAQLEAEARRISRHGYNSKSTYHLNNNIDTPLQVHTREGPAERRIYRIQKREGGDNRDDRRYRSSIAF